MSHLGETPTARAADEAARHLRSAARPKTYRPILPDRFYLEAEAEMRGHHEAMISTAFAQASQDHDPEERP